MSFSGVGFKPRNAIRAQPTWNATWKQYPITYKTDNNKMQMSVRFLEFKKKILDFLETSKIENNRIQMSVRSLELIFTETDWPATERQLEVSIDQKRDWKVEKNSRYLGKQQYDQRLGEPERIRQIASRPLATCGKHGNQYCN